MWLFTLANVSLIFVSYDSLKMAIFYLKNVSFHFKSKKYIIPSYKIGN